MRNRNKFLIILGSLLIAISLIFSYKLKSRENEKRDSAKKLEENFKTLSESNNDLKKDQTDKINKNSKAKADDITSDEAIGVIRIDKIEVLAEIFDNTNDDTLLKGVGLIETTDMPSSKLGTTCAIAGHRGGTSDKLSFLNIDKLTNGDEIQITTKNEVLTYKVSGSEVIEPDDWSKFQREDDKSRLILMACHPYPINDKRILIYAELAKDQ